jgi:hypothetical protein
MNQNYLINARLAVFVALVATASFPLSTLADDHGAKKPNILFSLSASEK